MAFSINIRIPGYKAFLDDGSRIQLESAVHVIEVYNIEGYSMHDLLNDSATKTIWGTCQEPLFWYWNREKKGLDSVLSDQDLQYAFKHFESSKIVNFVVEIAIKPGYQSSIAMEEKLAKLPLRRNINLSQEASTSVAHEPKNSNSAAANDSESNSESGSDDGSSSEDDNVDPVLMDDTDIFMDDDDVFVTLGLRAEDEVTKINIIDDMGHIGHAQVQVNDTADVEPRFEIDKENPKIKVGETFPTMHAFRMALRQHAIKREFAVHKIKTDKNRYRAQCKAEGCPWRIVAHKLQGQPTVEITMIPNRHDCVSSAKTVNKMASQQWVADRIIGWLRKTPSLGTSDLQDKLLEKYNVEIGYNTVWAGRQKALDAIFGAWEDTFPLLYNFKAELLQRSPNSVFEICTSEEGEEVYFSKLFLAMKPCIDGFLEGCRPYLGVDSTALNGKYKGHLASATALDGNNWMYPVAWAIFDSESTENWTWFMRQLKKAIGRPPVLAISSDACKALSTAVKEVFPGIEHRECMRHLWSNFKKYYRGDVYDKNMWPAARAYKRERFQYHFNQVVAANPDVVEYLNSHHSLKWSRSMFSNAIKCDYVNNNLAESFNSWIKKIKDLPLVEILDILRKMTMDLWEKRRRIGVKFSGNTLPTVIKQLKAKTRGLGQMKVSKNQNSAEVFGLHYDMTPWRHIVELNPPTCSCGEWQMTGKPCLHALAFIQMLPDVEMENAGFKLRPPPYKRGPGRQRKNRFKASHEPGAKKQQRCKKCLGFGHRDGGNCPLNEERKRKRCAYAKRQPKKPKTVPVDTISPGSITRRMVSLIQGENDIASCSSSSAKRLLVLSEGDDFSSI